MDATFRYKGDRVLHKITVNLLLTVTLSKTLNFAVLTFMPAQPVLQRRHYVFALSVAVSVFRYYFSLRQNAGRISIKFAGGNNYHEQIKWLHFWRNWKRNKGAWYDRIFKSTSIGFAAMSNRDWRLANEFTNFTAQTTTDVIMETISR